MSVAPPRELQRCTQLLREGRFAECKPLALQLAARFPHDPPVMRLVLQCLGALGEHHAALYHAKRLLATNPADAGLHLNLARLHARLGQIDAATARYEDAITRGMLEMIPELAQLRLGSGRISEGLLSLRQHEELIVRALVDDTVKQAMLARVQLVKAQLHFASGDVEQCVRVCEAVRVAEPDVAASVQAVKASCLNYVTGVPQERVWAEHRRFGELLEFSIPDKARVWGEQLTDSLRPIHVGVVSPDMRMHSVAVFALPLLRQLFLRPHDFHVSVFHVGGVEDAMTTRLRACAHAWHHLPQESPEQIARAVANAKVDIAIELAGLTDTLGVCALAHRPAPVTVTAIGYPNTCGTARVHYRIVDEATDPPEADAHAAEKLVRLDPCFLCYTPPAEAPEVLRSTRRSGITFGCFNAAQKLNRDLMQMWRELLDAVPSSSLLLKSTGLREESAIREMRERLSHWGMPMERVRMVAATASRAEHLAMYGQIDIALDAFPYHGTTTTCEALYMGVPVVVLAGDRHVSRVGVSLLRAVGVPDLITSTPTEYIRCAGQLANDAERLSHLHATLRAKVLASPLCDEAAYGERLAIALQEMWTRACAATL